MAIEQGKIRVYACGGAGVNIGALLEKHRNAEENAAASLNVTYVDTSESNFARNRHAISDEHCYVIKCKDGSGSVRAENYDPIVEHMKDFLQQHKPMDLNIVISSAGGGSGSVIAPVIVGELLDRKVPVIVLLVGSTATKTYAENTQKTIKSYESISLKKKAPIVAIYDENSEKTPRAQVDDNIKYAILSLAILFSRQNHELDTMDLFNWLRYDRVPSCTFPPQLVALTIMDGRELTSEINDLGHVISVATVGSNPDHVHFPFVPDYQCAGFLPDTASERFKERCPFNFIVSDGVFPEVNHRLEMFIQGLKDNTAARIVKRNILSKDDNVTENGVVL